MIEAFEVKAGIVQPSVSNMVVTILKKASDSAQS
jgi:hypothetical protein